MRHRHVVAALAMVVFWIVPCHSARACVIHVVDRGNVLDLISGTPVAEMGDSRIVGVVELEVFATWPATDTYRPASMAAPAALWGETPEVPAQTHGGQSLVPPTTSDCPDFARDLGRTWWLAVFEANAGGPGDTVLISPDLERQHLAVLTEHLGEPRQVDPPEPPARHPAELGEVATSILSAPSVPGTPQVAAPSPDADVRHGPDMPIVSIVVGIIALVAVTTLLTMQARRARNERPRSGGG